MTTNTNGRDPIGDFLIGKIAIPNHPATVLNPNGYDGFVITEVIRNIHDGSFSVHGKETMWFNESVLLEIRDATTTNVEVERLRQERDDLQARMDQATKILKNG